MLYAFDAGDAGALYNAGMLKVFTNIKQCKDDTALMAWTRRIIVNTCLDHCRQKLKFTIYPEAVESVDAFIEPGVYDKISAAETLELLKQIPVNAAVVFNLFVIEGYKHAEIAQLLGIPEGTSKWQLNEARKLLKQKLETMHKNKNYSHVSW